MSARDDSPTWGRGHWIAFVLLAVALTLTRLVDLGRQSPWNDEVMCWIWATEFPTGAYGPAHTLTYAAQAKSLALLGDTITALRLPGSLASLVGGLALFATLARRRLGLGIAFGILFTLNPFLLFHGQDGNHYGWSVLGGSIAAAAAIVWWSDAARGWRIAAMGGGFAVAYLVLHAHPMNALLFGGLAGVVWADALLRPDRVPFLERVPAAMMRRVMVVLGIVGTAVAVYLVHRTAMGMTFVDVPTATKFTLGIDFQTRLWASLLAGYSEWGIADRVAGVLGLLAVVWGFLRAARVDRPTAGVAFMTTSMLFVLYGIFALYSFTHSFHVRYIAFTVPGLLVGWAFVLDEGIGGWLATKRTGEDLSPAGRRALIVGTVATVALAMRVAPWAGAHYAGHYQPIVPAMEWAKANLPEGSILATRAKYLAASTRFLAPRVGIEERDLTTLYLGETAPYSTLSAQRARVLEAEHPGLVYLFEQADFEDAIKQDYADFRASGAERLVHFGASIEPDWLAANRAIEIARVKPDPKLGTFPMPGNAAHALAPADVGFYPFRTRGTPMPAVILSPGTSGTWWIRREGAPDAIDLDVTPVVPPGTRLWMVARFGEAAPIVWELNAEKPAVFVRIPLRWPKSASGPGERLRIAVAADWSGDPTVRPRAAISFLRAAKEGREVAPTQELLFGRARGQRLTDAVETLGKSHRFVPPLDFGGAVAEWSLPPTSTNGALLLIEYAADGLSGSKPRTVVVESDGSTRTAESGAETGFTDDRAMFAVRVRPFQRGARVRLDLRHETVYGPHGGAIEFRRPMVLLLDRSAVQAVPYDSDEYGSGDYEDFDED